MDDMKQSNAVSGRTLADPSDVIQRGVTLEGGLGRAVRLYADDVLEKWRFAHGCASYSEAYVGLSAHLAAVAAERDA